jgi:hypothetical protein
LSGPFPASLAKIPQLSFLYVRNARTRLVQAIGFLPRFHTTALFFCLLLLWFLLRFKSNSSIRDSMRLVGVCSVPRDLSFNNLTGPVPLFPTRTFK